MISRADFDAYGRAVSAITDGASAECERQVVAWCRANPDATVAEVREAAREIMDGLAQVYDEASASFAAEWYDAQAQAAGARLPEAVTVTTYSPEQVERVARYQAAKLVAGDVEGFARACGEFLENGVRRSLNETIIANAGRDRESGVRFARVPTGRESCTFCLMLASRGAVYHSRETAGLQSHYHRGCDCKIVPGFESDPGAEIVEGYNPSALYSDYLDGKFGTFKSKRRGTNRRKRELVADGTGRRFENVGEMSRYLRESPDLDSLYARCDEVEQALGNFFRDKRRRDLYLADLRRAASRRHGELTSGGGRGIVTYTKPRSELEPHEAAGIDRLSALGYDIETIPEIGDAPANLDIIMDGREWEMKNVTNAHGSVGNQMARARKKYYVLPGRENSYVVTCEGSSDSFEEVSEAVGERLRKGETAIVVGRDGEFERKEK